MKGNTGRYPSDIPNSAPSITQGTHLREKSAGRRKAPSIPQRLEGVVFLTKRTGTPLLWRSAKSERQKRRSSLFESDAWSTSQ